MKKVSLEHSCSNMHTSINIYTYMALTLVVPTLKLNYIFVYFAEIECPIIRLEDCLADLTAVYGISHY